MCFCTRPSRYSMPSFVAGVPCTREWISASEVDLLNASSLRFTCPLAAGQSGHLDVVLASVVCFPFSVVGAFKDPSQISFIPTSVQVRLPPEFKHINKGRKRN